MFWWAGWCIALEPGLFKGQLWGGQGHSRVGVVSEHGRGHVLMFLYCVSIPGSADGVIYQGQGVREDVESSWDVTEWALHS